MTDLDEALAEVAARVSLGVDQGLEKYLAEQVYELRATCYIWKNRFMIESSKLDEAKAELLAAHENIKKLLIERDELRKAIVGAMTFLTIDKRK